jgi:hypothetical protein
VAKATAIANATPATNVFMVTSPISLDAYSGNPVMHSVMPVTESCFLLAGLPRMTKAAGSGGWAVPTPTNSIVIFVVLCLSIFGLMAFAKFMERRGRKRLGNKVAKPSRLFQ